VSNKSIVGLQREFRDFFQDLFSAGHWVTLKNGRKLKIDSDGRIVAGLPERYHGTRLRDLSRLSHDERQLEGIDCEEIGKCHTCRHTFRTPDEAASAILQANPRFAELRESEFGAYDVEFLKWRRAGRRGPKPTTALTDGRLDAINEHFELTGKNRVFSFTEALYYVIPRSKKWADLDDAALSPLSEAAGFQIQPPDETLQVQAGKLTEEECRADVDRRLGELFAAAKSADGLPPAEADTPPPSTDAEVPF